MKHIALNPSSKVETLLIELTAAIEQDARYLGSMASSVALRGDLELAHGIIDTIPAIQDVLKGAESLWEKWQNLFSEELPKEPIEVAQEPEAPQEAPVTHGPQIAAKPKRNTEWKTRKVYDYEQSSQRALQAIMAGGGFLSPSQFTRAAHQIADTMGGDFFTTMKQADLQKVSNASMLRHALKKYMVKKGWIANHNGWAITPQGRNADFAQPV